MICEWWQTSPRNDRVTSDINRQPPSVKIRRGENKLGGGNALCIPCASTATYSTTSGGESRSMMSRSQGLRCTKVNCQRCVKCKANCRRVLSKTPYRSMRLENPSPKHLILYFGGLMSRCPKPTFSMHSIPVLLPQQPLLTSSPLVKQKTGSSSSGRTK